MEMFRYMRDKVGKLDPWEAKVVGVVKKIVGEERIEAIILYDDGIDFNVDNVKASMICKIKDEMDIDVDLYTNYDGSLSIFAPRINTEKLIKG